MKEATSRIKINKLLEAAGWRFFPDLLPALQVSAQFVRQRRQDRHVTISLAFGMSDVDLRRIAIEEQVLASWMLAGIFPSAWSKDADGPRTSAPGR